jgi:hypothetical protein
MVETFTRDQKLDVFYPNLLAVDEKQGLLWKVVKMVLTVPHGNALV